MSKIKYLWRNKKTLISFLTTILIVGIFFFSLLLLIFSTHQYLVKEVKENMGNYHVKIETDLKGIENVSYIKKIKWEKEVLITYNDINKTYQNTKKLCTEVKCQNITYNDSLLSLYGVSKKENILNIFKTLIIVSFVLILSFGFIIISSSYNIILSSKYKDLAILKTIGFTNKNILVFLLIENILITFIALFLAFIISLITTYIIIILINHLTLEVINLTLTINFKFIVFSILFILIFVLGICLITVFKLWHKPVINNLKPKIVYKKVKKYKNIYFRLAYFNYKRNVKQFRPVIISLWICFILIGTFTTYLDYGTKIINHYVTRPNYDAEIISDNKKILEDFLNENKYQKKALYKMCDMPLTISKEYTLAKKAKTVKGIIIEGGNTFVNKSTVVKEKKGKIVKEEKSFYQNKIKVLNRELKADNHIPYGLSLLANEDNLIIKVDNIENICNYNYVLFVKSKDKLPLDKLLNQGNIIYKDMRKANLIIDNFILIFKLLLMGIISLITLIIISAIISTVAISFKARKKEFGILKALGLTSFNPLIIYESLIISLKAFLYSLPVVCFINYIVVTALNEVFEITLSFSLKPLLITLIVSIILIRGIMQALHYKIKKENISELLK